MVMLYERNHEGDNVTNKQFFRCTIEEIHPERMLLKLSYKQRNAGVFRPDSLYAVEPVYMDATFNQAYSDCSACSPPHGNGKSCCWAYGHRPPTRP